MGKLFGTDGIRGVVGENLTADMAFRVVQAVGIEFQFFCFHKWSSFPIPFKGVLRAPNCAGVGVRPIGRGKSPKRRQRRMKRLRPQTRFGAQPARSDGS